MVSETKNEIQAIKSEIEQKEKQIDTLRKEVRELKLRKKELETGLKVGDVVQKANGTRGVLSGLEGFGTFWVWRKIRKDGTLSVAQTTLLDPVTKVPDVEAVK